MTQRYSWYGGPTSTNKYSAQADQLRNSKSFKSVRYCDDSKKLGKLFDEVWAKVEGIEGLEGLHEEKVRTQKMIEKNKYLKENPMSMVYARTYLHKLEDQEVRLERQIASKGRSKLEATAGNPAIKEQGQDAQTEQRPAVKYPHVRAPMIKSTEGTTYSPAPQHPFGSVPAHIQEKKREETLRLSRMGAENSLPSKSLFAQIDKLTKRNPIKTAIAAGIVGLAGLGAWVAHEYNIYKTPVLTQPITSPTRVSVTEANTPTAREYTNVNTDIQLPEGFSLVSPTTSRDSPQARLPEKPISQVEQVINKKQSNKKSLEHRLSGWFSELSRKKNIFTTRFNQFTKRMSEEYELLEDPQPRFNLQTTKVQIASANIVTYEPTDESLTVRVGPAEKSSSEVVRKPMMPLQGFWEEQTPSGKVVQYAVGNSGLPKAAETDSRIKPLEAEPLHPYIGDPNPKHYNDWINEVATRDIEITQKDIKHNISTAPQASNSASTFIGPNFFKEAQAKFRERNERALNHAKRVAETRLSLR